MNQTDFSNLSSLLSANGDKYWNALQEHHAFAAANAEYDLAQHQAEITYVFGLSDFIGDKMSQHPDWLVTLFTRAEQQANNTEYATELATALEQVSDETTLLRTIRHFRHRQMIAIAWRDLTNRQNMTESLAQVSDLANALILQTYNWLYQAHCKQYGEPIGEHGPQPLLIMAMGKLGGGELNFSSDIDLIFAYPEKGETNRERKPVENQQFFHKLAQKVINALNKITIDGQVFRVDMRLRPFGDSGPLVMHFDGMEDYFQDQGRQWERFAMVKARIVNEPDAYTQALSDILRPFTFRRYLDFTTIDALRSMKQMISTEIRRRRLTDNIKLGAGGIREVEFFAQSFQLIHGGKEPKLQHKNLKVTLDALAELSLVDHNTVDELYADYLFLRKVEHTLQQMQDKQTQTLPDSEWGKEVLIKVLGFADYETFYTHLNQAMARIHGHFNALIEETQDSHDETDSLYQLCIDSWQVGLSEDEFVTMFAEQPFAAILPQLYKAINDFTANLRNYRLGERGQQTLQKLLPEVLYTVINHSECESEQVLTRVLSVINSVAGRTTYLDLLLENPDVLKQLVKLCTRSGWIAEQVRRFPLLLDELITPIYLQQQDSDIATSKHNYAADLRQTMLRVEHDDTEAVMETLRQYKLCQQLRIAASDISGSLPINFVSDKLTVLAEVVLEFVIQSAWHQMSDKFGQPEHLGQDQIGLAVVGYGKLGGYELGYGSDLDLVFIHNAPRESQTNGAKSISAQQFYIKLTQRIMHMLNANTLFGQLYEADLRLRPSGNSGLLCCSIAGFADYQQTEAWTWEHQALVRARAVVGDVDLVAEFNHIRADILGQTRDLAKLVTDVTDMRKKMRDHLLTNNAPGIDLKQCEGGITDIEFITQYLVLAHAHAHDTMTVYSDNLRILDAAVTAKLIDEETGKQLQDAYLLLREHYHQLTLADSKYATESDTLNQVRQTVTEIWAGLFGHV